MLAAELFDLAAAGLALQLKDEDAPCYSPALARLQVAKVQGGPRQAGHGDEAEDDVQIERLAAFAEHDRDDEALAETRDAERSG